MAVPVVWRLRVGESARKFTASLIMVSFPERRSMCETGAVGYPGFSPRVPDDCRDAVIIRICLKLAPYFQFAS